MDWARAHPFLNGCGLLGTPEHPARWAHWPQWHVLDTDFGQGLNFLATWAAWRADAQRPQRLFFTAITDDPVTPEDLLRCTPSAPEWQPLTDELLAQWRGLLPGVHRLVLEQGAVQLTLCVGSSQEWLPTLDAAVDAVFLHGLGSDVGPEMGDLQLIRSVARLCRTGTALTANTAPPSLNAALVSGGFEVAPVAPLSSGQAALRAHFAPKWVPRHAPRPALAQPAGHALVVGGGLAGSAAAWSLAERGWTVDVLDAAEHPAAGASGLPAGLVAPHVSPDDAVLSRLSRSGVRLTLQRAAQCLQEHQDWAPSGVLEHRVEGKRGLPRTPVWASTGTDWSRTAHAAELALAHLPDHTPALWHAMAGWIRPATLVQAQLKHPHIRWHGGCAVHTLQRTDGQWQLHDANGRLLAQAPHVVLASAWATQGLLQQVGHETLPLNPLRGQITWGWVDALPPNAQALLPATPVNGHGSFVHGMPGPGNAQRSAWFTGSTFERGVTTGHIQPEDQAANQTKLARLLPDLAQAMAPAFEQAQAWAGVRCTLPDRLPAVGPVDSNRLAGLHVCAGMGARGLTLSVLCGEVLAALMHGEPWPLERKLAQGLMAERFVRTS
jgi:tRNA 5-methylaminomethyl-2-thiouridine biosynthesis bifunctional protein